METYKPDSKNIKLLYKDTRDKLDILHHRYVEGARFTGYIKDWLEADEPYWNALADYPPGDPDIDTTIMSGEVFLETFNQQLIQLENNLPNQSANLILLASAGSTFDANTASLSDIVPEFRGKELEHQPCPFINKGDYSKRAKQLEILDPSLADTYRQVWEILYGTQSEPERAALYQMRQTYDHFFDLLAPDDEVRKSTVFKEKNGEKPDLVSRSERIEYAAMTHIKDKTKAKFLSSSAKPILKVYNELNQAHKRGELEPNKARKALFAMDEIISDWLDALDMIPKDIS